MRTILGLALLATSLAAGAQQMYRWTDSTGKIHFTDTPPPASAREVRRRGDRGGNTAESPEPYALQMARKKAPVKLYSTPGCEACNEARSLLNARGIPFTEVSISDPESAAAFKKTIGGTSVPVLVVGSRVQKGFEETLYNGALDAAGYPRQGVLRPRNQTEPTAADKQTAEPEAEAEDSGTPASGPYAPR